MVELELLQGGESAVALFGQLEPTVLAGARLRELVFRAGGDRPAQEGQRDGHDARSRQESTEHE